MMHPEFLRFRKDRCLICLLPIEIECPNWSCWCPMDGPGDDPGGQTPCPPQAETTDFFVASRGATLHTVLPHMVDEGFSLVVRPPRDMMACVEAILRHRGFEPDRPESLEES